MEKEKIDRRTSLLVAGRELLSERGSIAAVRLDEVAAWAGVTKMTLYRYFPSKEALFEEVLASFDEPGEIQGRREKILLAALRLVPDQGLHGVTMEKIATEAGVSPATLYWHFKNKDDLLLAMVEQFVGQIDFASIFPREAVGDADTLIQAITPQLLRLLDERVSLFPIMLVEVMVRPDLAALLYDRVASKIWSAVTTFIDQQVQTGAFRPGHPLLRMFALAGMSIMYSLARRNFGVWVDIPPPEQASREFADIFLHGVIAEPSGGKTNV